MQLVRLTAEAVPKSEAPSGMPSTSTRASFNWRCIVCIGLAGVFFSLALAGVLLPGIPATPFLLLTSYFLVRSSPRLNAALLRSRIFGPILVDWQVHGGVRTHVRLKSIAAVVIAVAITTCVSGYSLAPTLAVVSLAAVGIAVILRLPAAREY